MAALRQLIDRYQAAVARARQRSELVDHVFRTKERYGAVLGGRLAAAIAYYGFFATFAFGVLGYAILGFLVEHQVDVRQAVAEFLAQNLPAVEPEQISAGRGLAGAFGLIGLVLTGLAWVEALRSSQRQVWLLEQEPGNVFKRRLIDVGMLAGLALLLGVSLAVTGVIEYLLAGVPVLRPAGWLLMVGVNLVIAVGLLAVLPRLRMPARQLLPPAVAVGIGLVILNTLGRAYLERVQDNPAYAVVATAAGLLVYLYLVHQLVLFGAAWAATSQPSSVKDRAAGGRRARPDRSEPAG